MQNAKSRICVAFSRRNMYSTCVYANLLNGPTIYRKLGNANIARTYIDTRYRMFHPITKTDQNQNGPLPKRTITKTIEIKNVNFLNK